MLTIVDTFSRFSPALAPRFAFLGADIVAVLERACKKSGISGKRSASITAASSCRAIRSVAYQRGVTLDFSRPGQPTDDAFIASAPNALRPIGSCSLRMPRKKWGIGADTTMKNDPTGRSSIDS
ncbi:hypothetical protein ACVIYL_008966 [Bradyrhizobium sp. USDA 3315]